MIIIFAPSSVLHWMKCVAFALWFNAKRDLFACRHLMRRTHHERASKMTGNYQVIKFGP